HDAEGAPQILSDRCSVFDPFCRESAEPPTNAVQEEHARRHPLLSVNHLRVSEGRPGFVKRSEDLAVLVVNISQYENPEVVMDLPPAQRSVLHKTTNREKSERRQVFEPTGRGARPRNAELAGERLEGHPSPSRYRAIVPAASFPTDS